MCPVLQCSQFVSNLVSMVLSVVRYETVCRFLFSMLKFLLAYLTMPKINANLFNKYVKQFGEDTFATDGRWYYALL